MLEDLIIDILNNACGNYDQPGRFNAEEPGFNGRMRYNIETHCLGFTVTATPPRYSGTGAWVIHNVEKYDC